MANTPTIYVPKGMRVPPDNDKQWENKFFIRSESSDNLYTVSQHINGRYWGCSCPAWRTRKRCKHLRAIGLPEEMRPYEAKLEG